MSLPVSADPRQPLPPPLCTEGLAWGHPGGPLLGEALSLEVGAGKALAVVGPNGAGKSTLLRTLAGLLPARAGRARVSGDDPSRLRPARRAHRVALLPQGAAVDHDLTVTELVELGRTAHLGTWGWISPTDREAVTRALQACALTELGHRRLGQISGGERQRALIAMTLAQAAPLLLLDEPTSHLDLRHRHLLFELLGKLRGEGLAMVLVLHDLAEAFAECDRVVVLGDGRVEELPAHPDPAEPTRAEVRRRLAAAFGVPIERIPPLGR